MNEYIGYRPGYSITTINIILPKWIAIYWSVFTKKRTLKAGFSISSIAEMMPQGYRDLQGIPSVESGLTLAKNYFLSSVT